MDQIITIHFRDDVVKIRKKMIMLSETIKEMTKSTNTIIIDCNAEFFKVIAIFCKHHWKEQGKKINFLEEVTFENTSTDWDKLFFNKHLLRTKIKLEDDDDENDKELIILLKYLQLTKMLKIYILHNLICLKICNFLNCMNVKSIKNYVFNKA